MYTIYMITSNLHDKIFIYYTISKNLLDVLKRTKRRKNDIFNGLNELIDTYGVHSHVIKPLFKIKEKNRVLAKLHELYDQNNQNLINFFSQKPNDEIDPYTPMNVIDFCKQHNIEYRKVRDVDILFYISEFEDSKPDDYFLWFNNIVYKILPYREQELVRKFFRSLCSLIPPFDYNHKDKFILYYVNRDDMICYDDYKRLYDFYKMTK